MKLTKYYKVADNTFSVTAEADLYAEMDKYNIFAANVGDTVLTPFMGIGSEVYEAVKLKRFGIGFELKDSYFAEAVKNVKAIEMESKQKGLFD